MAKKRFNLYNLIHPDRDGKGVDKHEMNHPRDLPFFFKLFFRNFGKCAWINLFMLLGNFPIFFGLIGAAGYFNVNGTAPASSLYAPLYGAMLHSSSYSPATMALYGVHGISASVSIPTTATYVFYGLTALVLLTFGCVNAGTTYQLRNIVKGEPVFLWSDFFTTIRKNWKQALPFGILDGTLLFLLAYDILFFYYNIGPFWNNVLFYLALAVAVIYLLMRFYIYIIMVTFDLSIRKILKNALIFSIIGFKRNFMAVLGILVVIMLNYALLLVFIPLGILLPFIFTVGVCTFISTYAAWPKIKELMIDPYYVEDDTPKEEPIFHDVG